VRIRGYFAKPKGVREEKSLTNTVLNSMKKLISFSQKKNFASIKMMKRLVLNTKIISVYSENHAKPTSTLIGELLVM